MNVKQCDQCNAVIPKHHGFYLRNEQSAVAAGITAGQPMTVDLCSWHCVEEYARHWAS